MLREKADLCWICAQDRKQKSITNAKNERPTDILTYIRCCHICTSLYLVKRWRCYNTFFNLGEGLITSKNVAHGLHKGSTSYIQQACAKVAHGCTVVAQGCMGCTKVVWGCTTVLSATSKQVAQDCTNVARGCSKFAQVAQMFIRRFYQQCPTRLHGIAHSC